jgi:hypothetical protein
MKNKKQDKQLEKLLFEVYDKGVKQQECNLTEYIEKVKQALRIHDVSGSLGFDKGYEQGYNDATKEACQEIREHYHPNDR